MRAVPVKSSETGAILLLISSADEHLYPLVTMSGIVSPAWHRAFRIGHASYRDDRVAGQIDRRMRLVKLPKSLTFSAMPRI
jgi:hypothetical protein